MRIKLKNVRLAFPVLFEPRSGGDGDGDPAFSATFLLDPKTNAEDIAKVEAAIEEVAKAKWKGKAEQVLKSLRASDKICLRDGAAKAEYEGFDGKMFVAARNKVRPKVLDRDLMPLSQQDGRPYGGCYVGGIIDIWAQDNNYGKRVNASLTGVVFLRDGDAFGGGGAPAADEDFEDLVGDEDNGDLI